MVRVTHYTVEKGPGAYRIRARDPPLCPACGVLLSGYDTRPRRVVDSSGAVLLFQLRRLRCPSCHRLHLELPDFMRPYKHYASPVIEALEAGPQLPAPPITPPCGGGKNHPPTLPVHPARELIPWGRQTKKGGELYA